MTMKPTAKKRASAKSSIKRKVAFRPATKKATLVGFGAFPGYEKRKGIYTKNTGIQNEVVAPSAIKKGFGNAKKHIEGMIDLMSDIMSDNYKIGEIEFEISFSADGKFMGFGVGGATSIKIKIIPL